METKIDALPREGAAKPAHKTYISRTQDRWLLAGTLLLSFLTVDTLLWSRVWGLGVTAAVAVWEGLLLAAQNQPQDRKCLQTGEGRALLAANLALGLTFSLTSSPWFRWWNFGALLILLPIQACGLSQGAGLSWRRPWMLWERLELLCSGLFGHLGASFSALSAKRRWEERRIWSVILGICGACALVSFLLPVLTSADALFADAAARFSDFFRRHFAEGIWKIAAAAALTPFLFGLLYSLRKERAPLPPPEALPAADGVLFAIVLAALDALYLLFLAVQSAGLFGGPDYLASRGLSYAQWARSGFFQITGVTAVNLAAMLAAVTFSRPAKRSPLRLLALVLAAESLVLLASAAWRMTLYVSAYGLSFKRCMTYWGMGMMALLLLAALGKVWRPDKAFCRLAFPILLAGWLFINCVPVDYLTAKNQVDRYLSGESGVIGLEYLARELSYDTLGQLERLDRSMICRGTDRAGWIRLEKALEQRRTAAQAECRDWRSWNLSAFLAGNWS